MSNWTRPWQEPTPEVKDEAVAALVRFAEQERENRRQRWLLVKRARELGVTWAVIGDSLGLTKQRAHQILAEGDWPHPLPDHSVEAVRSAVTQALQKRPPAATD